MDCSAQTAVSHAAASHIPNTRVRTGCLTCRSRKVKCDERRPKCLNCARLKRHCTYQQRPSRTSWTPNATSESPLPNTSQHVTPPDNEPSVSEPQANDLFFPSGFYTGQIYQEQDFFLQDPFSFDDATMLSVPQSSKGDMQVGSDQILLSGGSGVAIHSERSQFTATSEALSPSQSSPNPICTPSVEYSTILSPFQLFLDHVEPPFISPVDLSNWTLLKQYLAQVGSRDAAVGAALRAVQTLYAATIVGKEISEAMSLYYSTKSMYEKMLVDENQDFHTLLVVTFLLCVFEVVTQHETVSVTAQPDGTFARKLEQWSNRGNWPPVSRRIVVWLRILHGCAMHMGNRGLLSVKVRSLFPEEKVEIPSLLFLDPHPEAATSLLDVISRPLFEFYLEVQKLSVQISHLNRHHRPRGMPADEGQVQQIFEKLEKEFSSLWHSRTSLLRQTPVDARAHLSAQVANPIIKMMGLCIASYHSGRVDLRRSYGRPLLASPESKKAMDEIRRVVDGDYNSFHGGLLCSGYLWPIFVYALESMNTVDAHWAVTRLRQVHNPLCRSDFIARLADDITSEQIREGKRIDVRYFCFEKYGSPPPYM